jgi:3-keto-5-aminohexanoate cleavage enzyme
LTAGGNVRIGFENCIHIENGVRADGNAQMVAKIVRFAEEMGRETAGPAEERKLLHL